MLLNHKEQGNNTQLRDHEHVEGNKPTAQTVLSPFGKFCSNTKHPAFEKHVKHHFSLISPSNEFTLLCTVSAISVLYFKTLFLWILSFLFVNCWLISGSDNFLNWMFDIFD